MDILNFNILNLILHACVRQHLIDMDLFLLVVLIIYNFVLNISLPSQTNMKSVFNSFYRWMAVAPAFCMGWKSFSRVLSSLIFCYYLNLYQVNASVNSLIPDRASPCVNFMALFSLLFLKCYFVENEILREFLLELYWLFVKKIIFFKILCCP